MGKDNILEDFYFGKIIPWEIQHPASPELLELRTLLESEVQQLNELLPEDGRKLLENLLSDRADMECYAVSNGFQDGFRLGARITTAVLADGKIPLQPLCTQED